MEVNSELRRRAQRRRLLAARRYRSRRFWRTISRRRKLVGAAVLAVLVLCVGAVYWFTSPSRIEAMAEQYLTELTGRKVRIHDARFSPFEGIRLRQLRVWPDGSQSDRNDDAEFTAEEVLLELEPGSLLAGRLKVTRIVAMRPEVRRVKTIGRAGSGTGGGYSPPERINIKLPMIELREGKFTMLSRFPEGEPVAVWETPLSAELAPDPTQPDLYKVNARIGQSGHAQKEYQCRIGFNPFRVEIDPVVVHSLQELPKYLSDILARYEIDPGRVRMHGGFNAGNEGLLAFFECRGTRMSLPLDDMLKKAEPASQPDKPLPSIKLTDVDGVISVWAPSGPARQGDPLPQGKITFGQPAKDGEPALPMRGKLNGCDFELIGQYEGFTADAGCSIDGRIKRLPIPTIDQVPLARLPRGMDNFWEKFDPGGHADFELHIARAARGTDVQVSCVVHLIDCTGSYELYPYRLVNVNGTIEFDGRRTRLDIVGRHGNATVAVKGWCGVYRPWAMDLTITGRRVAVDSDLRNAIFRKHSRQVSALEHLKVLVPPVPAGLDPKTTTEQQAAALGLLRLPLKPRPQDHPEQEYRLATPQQQWAEKQSPLWQVDAEADFTAHVWRDDRPDSSTKANITIDQIRNLDITFGPFKYLGRILSGSAGISDAGVRLRHLAILPRHLLRSAASQPAANSSAVMLADGFIGPGDNDGQNDMHLEVSAESLPLDETLWRAFPAGTAAELLKYHIDARAAVFGTITSKPGLPLQFDFTGQLHGGGMNADMFPYGLDSLTGRFRVTNETIELDNVVGSHNAVPIVACGRIGVAASQPTELTIRCDRMALDADLKSALSADMQKVWTSMEPRGRVAIDAAIRQPATQPDNPDKRPPLTTTTAITALGNELCYSEFPYPLKNVTGQVIIHPDRVQIVRISDEQAGRQIEVSGTLWPGRDNLGLPQGAKPLPKSELKISVLNGTFDEPLRKAVPWQIRKMWNDVLPAGQFDLHLDYLRQTSLGEPTRWDYAGRLDLRNGRGSFGITLDKAMGQISGHGAIVTGVAGAFVGTISLSEAVIAGRPVSSLSANITHDGRTNKLLIENMSARLHGGEVSGFAEIGVADPELPYRLSLVGREIDLNELINHGRKDEDRWDLSGKLQGRIAVDGKSASGGRRGNGEVVLTRAKIYQVPAILPVFGGRPKEERPNQAAQVVFYLDGNQLSFPEVYLRDPAISLQGAGGMDLDSQRIDLTFVVGQSDGKATGGFRVLEELIQGAGEELMRYRISGPLNQPKAEATTLNSLRKAIEELNEARTRYRRPAATPPKDPTVNTGPLPGIQPSVPGVN